MEIKVNKVPLVGPRGRKELLNRINELEEKLNKALELANAQSDWEQGNNTAPDYIKNKPETGNIPEFDSIPWSGIAVESIDAYQDALAIKVGGKVYVRNQYLTAINDDLGIPAHLGITLTGKGAIFCESKQVRINTPMAAIEYNGFAVYSGIASPNPSALTLGIVPIEGQIS